MLGAPERSPISLSQAWTSGELIGGIWLIVGYFLMSIVVCAWTAAKVKTRTVREEAKNLTIVDRGIKGELREEEKDSEEGCF